MLGLTPSNQGADERLRSVQGENPVYRACEGLKKMRKRESKRVLRTKRDEEKRRGVCLCVCVEMWKCVYEEEERRYQVARWPGTNVPDLLHLPTGVVDDVVCPGNDVPPVPFRNKPSVVTVPVQRENGQGILAVMGQGVSIILRFGRFLCFCLFTPLRPLRGSQLSLIFVCLLRWLALFV